MLTKRIIPCLDIMDGRVVKGVNFRNLTDSGDPVKLGLKYCREGADELVFLDIKATMRDGKAEGELVSSIAEKINIPFTVGGGIKNIEDVKFLLESGADKISVNSAAVINPLLITKLAAEFGSQCVVVAIDINKIKERWIVHINGGKTQTDREAVEWAIEASTRGAGELLITSMNRDGTCSGFDKSLIKAVTNAVNCPVIASGGGGREEDFFEIFSESGADAALAANIFHFDKLRIDQIKDYLHKRSIPVRRTV